MSQAKDHSLANKFRPTTFATLVGQPYAQGVGRALSKGLRMNGYLLAGPFGCGKTTVARIIAASLNASSKLNENGDPTDTEDVTAALVHNFAHPDVIEINAAENRGIDAVRKIIDEAHIGTPRGVRVYIIDEAHKLTPEAFTALLKPIEEPPRDVIFILCTTDVEKIPAAIVSRLPVIPILPFTTKTLVSAVADVLGRWAKEDGVEIVNPEKVAKQVAPFASQSMRTALTMAQNAIVNGVVMTPPVDIIDEVVDLVVYGRPRQAISKLIPVLSGEYDSQFVIQGLSVSLQNFMIDEGESFTKDNWDNALAFARLLNEVSHAYTQPISMLIAGIAQIQ